MTFREHIFVCLYERAPDDPKGCCLHRGGQVLFDQLKEQTRGIKGVRVNRAGCLGRCEDGPVVVRYPDAEWLAPATAEDCKALADKIRNG